MKLLPTVLVDTQRTFASQAEGMGVRLLVRCTHPCVGQEWTLNCDPTRVRGALNNFASNALKWSRPDEKLVTRLMDAGAPRR